MLQRIGKYDVQADLGRGSFTRVLRAWDAAANRLVALKVPAEEADRELFAYIQQEAAAVSNIPHLNIITVYDWGEDQGLPFIAVEFLQGEDLRYIIATRRPLSLAQKMQIMSQVADALEAAHRTGVVHLDIKPANIMLVPDGVVKVMDFGGVQLTERSAARLSEQGYLTTMVRYAAPEQFSGSTATDVGGDIFSYGVIYYELLSGRNPFYASDVSEVMSRILYEDPPPLRTLAPDCPEALERIVHRALAKNPQQRYQNLADLQADVRPLLIDAEQQGTSQVVEQCEQLRREGNFRQALHVLDSTLRAPSGNPLLLDLRRQVEEEFEQQEHAAAIQQVFGRAAAPVAKPPVTDWRARHAEPVPAQRAIEPTPVQSIVAPPAQRIVESTSASRVIEPMPMAREVDSTPRVIESIPMAHEVDSTPAQRVIESTPTAREVDSTPAQRVIESTPTAREVDSTSAQHVIESTPTARVVDSTPAQHAIESTPTVRVVDSTPSQRVIESTPTARVVDPAPPRLDPSPRPVSPPAPQPIRAAPGPAAPPASPASRAVRYAWTSVPATSQSAAKSGARDAWTPPAADQPAAPTAAAAPVPISVPAAAARERSPASDPTPRFRRPAIWAVFAVAAMALAVGGMLNFRSPEQPPAQEPVASTAASPDPAEGAVSPLAETPPESQPEPAPAQVVEIPAPVTAASSPAAGPSALPAAGTDTPSPGQPAKVSPAPRSFDTSLLRAKPAQPAAATGVDVPPPPSVPLSETEPVASSALPGAVVNPIATAPAPPPPSPQPRTGGHFQEPKLISGSPPALPALARERHVYGVVKMEATVAKDGAIKDVTVLSGDPILSSAAKNAVRKWRYKPAALNGEPIEAKVPIQVVFRPGQ